MSDTAARARRERDFRRLWLDRRTRKPVMLACDIVRVGVLAVIPVAVLGGQPSFGLLVIIQALSGAFSTVFDVAQ